MKNYRFLPCGKTPYFLWKTCEKDLENSQQPVEKNLAILEPVENPRLFPHVFHRRQIDTSYTVREMYNFFHIFHRPYYYYLKDLLKEKRRRRRGASSKKIR